MPSVIHSEDEFTDLPEVASATENGGTHAPYDISQQRTILEEGEKGGCLGACPQKSFSELRPIERQKTPFWCMVWRLLSELISVPGAKTNPLTWKSNTKKLRWPLLLLSYSPALETNLTQVRWKKDSIRQYVHEIPMWQGIIALQRDVGEGRISHNFHPWRRLKSSFFGKKMV